MPRSAQGSRSQLRDFNGDMAIGAAALEAEILIWGELAARLYSLLSSPVPIYLFVNRKTLIYPRHQSMRIKIGIFAYAKSMSNATMAFQLCG